MEREQAKKRQQSLKASFSLSPSSSGERLSLSKNHDDEFMKWSIPGNAIFVGCVIDCLMAVAMGQAIWQSTVEEWYPGGDVTARVRLAFGVRAFYSLIHGIWLLRVRSFLSMVQLQHVCGYQAARRVFVALWIYNQQKLRSTSDPMEAMKFNYWTGFEWFLHMGLLLVYLLGFLWAGQAEGFSTILTSEMEDDFGASQTVRRRSNSVKMD
mmetsp:Transcript_10774/g.29748  ORF Transcript_10774/g.29748 Transcript_10774/m.29748 type:complete len:210 (-) Transcript_10774:171-800(-)